MLIVFLFDSVYSFLKINKQRSMNIKCFTTYCLLGNEICVKEQLAGNINKIKLEIHNKALVLVISTNERL